MLNFKNPTYEFSGNKLSLFECSKCNHINAADSYKKLYNVTLVFLEEYPFENIKVYDGDLCQKYDFVYYEFGKENQLTIILPADFNQTNVGYKKIKYLAFLNNSGFVIKIINLDSLYNINDDCSVYIKKYNSFS